MNANAIANANEPSTLSAVNAGDVGVSAGVSAGDVGLSAGVSAGDELVDEEGSVVGVVLCVTDAAKVASCISGVSTPTVIRCTLPGPSGSDSVSGSGSGSGGINSISSNGPIIPTTEESKSVWESRLGGGINGGATATCLVLLKASYVVSDTSITTTTTTTTNNNDAISITTPSSSPSSGPGPSPVSLFIRSHLHPSSPLTSVTSWIPTADDDDSSRVTSPHPSTPSPSTPRLSPPRIAHPATFATYDTAYSPAPPVEKVMPPGK